MNGMCVCVYELRLNSEEYDSFFPFFRSSVRKICIFDNGAHRHGLTLDLLAYSYLLRVLFNIIASLLIESECESEREKTTSLPAANVTTMPGCSTICIAVEENTAAKMANARRGLG